MVSGLCYPCQSVNNYCRPQQLSSAPAYFLHNLWVSKWSGWGNTGMAFYLPSSCCLSRFALVTLRPVSGQDFIRNIASSISSGQSFSRPSSIQFTSIWYLCCRESPHALPISQKFPQHCLWNSSNVCLIDNGPLSSFQRRFSSASSFHACLLQTIDRSIIDHQVFIFFPRPSSLLVLIFWLQVTYNVCVIMWVWRMVIWTSNPCCHHPDGPLFVRFFFRSQIIIFACGYALTQLCTDWWGLLLFWSVPRPNVGQRKPALAPISLFLFHW